MTEQQKEQLGCRCAIGSPAAGGSTGPCLAVTCSLAHAQAVAGQAHNNLAEQKWHFLIAHAYRD